MKNIILFDFFGVICSEIAPFWFGDRFDKQTALRIKEELVGPADLGYIEEDVLFERIARACNTEADLVRREWMELAVIDWEMVELVRQLKEKYKVYLLSNAPGEFLHEILTKNNLYPLFDRMFISSEIKLAKPSRDFFEYCISKIGEPKEAMIFTDDNIKNVTAAREVGIDTIHFIGCEDYKARIKTLL